MGLDEQAAITDLQVFLAYAGDDNGKWQELVGQRVIHRRQGQGTITRVERSSPGTWIIGVHFERDTQEVRKYTQQTLGDPQYFSEVAVPLGLQQVATIRGQLLAEKQRRAEQERLRQEENRRREQERLERATQQRQDSSASTTSRPSGSGRDRRAERSQPGLPVQEEVSLIPGDEYRRRDLHDRFGGQEQGGISTPKHHHMILLFTGEAGEQHGYSDGWKGGVFLYTGEGQQGDMDFVRGNAAIRDSMDNGKVIHLFSQARKGYVRYIGQFLCTGYHYIEGRDTEDRKRRMIRFELTPVRSSSTS